MKFTPTLISGLYIINPAPLTDERGQFFRVFDKNDFLPVNFDKEFVQINRSFNKKKGTLRGLHFQKPPFTETKLIQCTHGKIYDVVVDLRKNSDTFLKWVSAELSSENKTMLLIPDGCAHGFQTMEDNSDLLYMHTQVYKKEAESAVRYDDPIISIHWPLPVSVISERDRMHPLLDKTFKGIEL